jgi:peptidyl-prolyl cis-trans isomerase SurA
MKKLLLCLVVLFPSWLLAQKDSTLIDEIIGVVGDEILLHSDIKSAEKDFAKGAERNAAPFKPCVVYEELLFQKLLLHQAKVDSVNITDAEVNGQVEQRLNYFIQMLGSVKEFEQYYGKTVSQMKEEFHDLIKDQMLAQREQSEVTKHVKVTPADVLTYFKTLPADSLPLISEQVQYSQLVINPIIREEEKDKIQNFLDSIRKDLINGRTSMTIQAAKWSEDPGSKYKGGCYPLQRKGSFVPEFEAAVFATPEGTYSPVFKSVYGYHFVKVIEKRGEFYEACHILMAPKIVADDLDNARLKCDSVFLAIRSDSLSFEKAVVRYSTDDETKNGQGVVVNPQTGSSRHDIGTLPADINLVIRPMKVGEISNPVLVTRPDGSQAYAIYKLVNRINAHRATMEQDYDIFKNRAEGLARENEIKKWVRKTLAKSYVYVHPDYQVCNFRFDWIKNKP